MSKEKEEEKKDVEKKADEISKAFSDGLSEIKKLMEEKSDKDAEKFKELESKLEDSQKNTLKVFVDQDTKKDFSELSDEEVSDAFALAMFTQDKKALEAFHKKAYDKLPAKQKALSEGTPADGGYLVPQEFYNKLVMERDEILSMRSKVTVIKVTTNTLTIPKHETGPEVYWTSEGASKTTTTMDFSQPTITVYKLAAIIYLTDELIEDAAFNLTDIIVKKFAVKMNEAVERAILVGTGVGQPTGIFIAGTIAERACAGNLDFDDLNDLIYDLPAKYRRGAEFIIHNNNIREMRKIKDDDGRYIWQDAVAPGQPSTVYGYPVYETYDIGEDEIGFGDWKETYWLTDRHQLRVKITNDTETTFTEDKTGIRVVERVGGTVVLPNAARILNTIP